MTRTAATPALTGPEFARVCALLYRIAGIKLVPGKEGLVQARLARRLHALDLDHFGAYFDLVERDGSQAELTQMVDLLTTNKTSFFREAYHFDFLRDRVLPGLAGRPARIWSAGCSTGEEPYSLGMLCRDTLGARADVRILATDISTRVLATAKAATYPAESLGDVPDDVRRRHFAPAADGRGVRVADAVREMVSFARLNLMGDWPMRGPFDAILCRNVMIYFDKPTQERLVNRFYELLPPGGHLFVGHSESLTSLDHGFAYVQPAVYVK